MSNQQSVSARGQAPVHWKIQTWACAIVLYRKVFLKPQGTRVRCNRCTAEDSQLATWSAWSVRAECVCAGGTSFAPPWLCSCGFHGVL